MSKTFTLKQLEVYKGEDDAERHEGKVVFAVRDAKNAANATKYNVYDVTKYLEDHPGGDDIMKENSGMDASDEFWDIGHSEQAMDDMKQYIIGQLSDEDCAALGKATRWCWRQWFHATHPCACPVSRGMWGCFCVHINASKAIAPFLGLFVAKSKRAFEQRIHNFFFSINYGCKKKINCCIYN